MCRYLKIRGIDITCVELNFYERDGHKLVDTKIVVGTEDIIYNELGSDIKNDSVEWTEILELASAENRTNVTSLISKIEQEYPCIGIPKGPWYNIRTKDKEKRFAILICRKNIARIAFRINPEEFSIYDPVITSVKGWFFPRETERRIEIAPQNFNIIMECIKHSYDTTINLSK